jgi:hypothetical protein
MEKSFMDWGMGGWGAWGRGVNRARRLPNCDDSFIYPYPPMAYVNQPKEHGSTEGCHYQH